MIIFISTHSHCASTLVYNIVAGALSPEATYIDHYLTKPKTKSLINNTEKLKKLSDDNQYHVFKTHEMGIVFDQEIGLKIGIERPEESRLHNKDHHDRDDTIILQYDDLLYKSELLPTLEKTRRQVCVQVLNLVSEKMNINITDSQIDQAVDRVKKLDTAITETMHLNFKKHVNPLYGNHGGHRNRND